MTCARCGGHADDLAIIADSTGESAEVCLTCGSAWLREVVADPDAPLVVFVGTATPAQRKAHEHRLRAAEKAEQDQAEHDAERRERAREAAERRKRRDEAKRAAKAAEADALREHRARSAARFVAAHGPVTLAEVAAALGISTRTLSRVTPLAIERGWIVVAGRRGLAAGPVRAPRDPDRADLDAAEERCWAAA